MARKRNKVNVAAIDDDILHPKNWCPEIHGPDHRVIWLDPDNHIFCLVDHEDYEHFHKWTWGCTYNSTKQKIYATRSTRLQGRSGPQVRLYLHKEILARLAPETHPRKEGQIIGDHINGNSLDNRRANLRWATPSENALNRKKG